MFGAAGKGLGPSKPGKQACNSWHAQLLEEEPLSCHEGETHPKNHSPKLSGPVRDTPPYRAIPFRDSIAEGGIAPICLFS